MTQERLSHLESMIEKKQRSFYEIGKALKEIRDERLYRILLFETFEAYTKTRWDIGKSQAYRLIEACSVIDNLSPIGEILPENESQVRALTQLEPFDQRKIWREFLKTGKELTALNIRKFISSCRNRPDKTQVDETEIISDSYREAVQAMLDQISLAQNDGWQTTSRQAGLFWNRVMKEKILLDQKRHNGKE